LFAGSLTAPLIAFRYIPSPHLFRLRPSELLFCGLGEFHGFGGNGFPRIFFSAIGSATTGMTG
jgi:hypothetical protein